MYIYFVSGFHLATHANFYTKVVQRTLVHRCPADDIQNHQTNATCSFIFSLYIMPGFKYKAIAYLLRVKTTSNIAVTIW